MSNETKNMEELSKPVAWVIGEQEIADFNRGYETFVVRGDDINGTDEAMPLHSQEYVNALLQRIAELEAIKTAAEKLVRCKGRYHSEQNYRALAALFGVTTPDLPPVEGDA